MNEKKMNILLHASQLIGMIFPFGGSILAPFIFWLIKKDDSELINEQGKKILNFQLSLFIYAIASFPLIIIFIGFIGLVACLLVAVIFPIIAMLKISNDEPFKYPLTIEFLK